MASGPLTGVKVLEFSQIIAGPVACQILSDLGAEVIKVEPPGGEAWRLSQQFVPLESKWFQAMNRGKQSLAVDVADPRIKEAIHRLVPEMDVVVINYRPDVAARLGIDYETLRALKPDLIYADNTAFGRNGPWAQRPGYDIVVQAASGMMASVGMVDDRGNPTVAGPFADYTTAYAVAMGVTAALFHRDRTGEGQMVETSLLINALTLQLNTFMSLPAADAEQRANFLASLEAARASGMPYADFIKQRKELLQRANGGNIYYRAFLTSDGAVAIGALSVHLRDKVRAAIGVEHNRDEPGWDPYNPEQQEVDRRVVEEAERIVREQSSEYWEERFESFGVPVSRVHFVEELMDHPQIQQNDYTVDLVHDLTGPQTQQAALWKMSATPPKVQGASPPLGRDTDEILARAGVTPEEIEELRARGAIR